MRIFLMIFSLFIFYSSLEAKQNSCTQEKRLESYKQLKVDIKKLLKALPKLTPSKKSFFQRAGLAYYNNNKQKYKKIVISNDFISYNNGAQLEMLLGAVNDAIQNNEIGDMYGEVKATAIISKNFILYSSPNESYMDSAVMLEKKIVDTTYDEISKNLYKPVVQMNECTCNLIFKIKNKVN